MRRSRIISTALALVLALSTLASCGSKQTTLFSWEQRPLNVIEDNYRNYYEIFVYSFYDSDGDGTGDLNGVTAKLDYVKSMGFNGIWLMPVCPSPTYHKYDVTNYTDIDQAYGSIEDFENLIKEAHKRDIRVIIDFVMNHTSSKHPWFTSAVSFLSGLKSDDTRSMEELEKECKYVGYYHFSREKLKGTYYKAGNSNFYYEGQFWSEMPDLNYSSEELRKEFEEITDFWLDKGVDGYRMDATLHFEEGDTGFNTEVMNWIYEYAKSKNPDFYMVSEVWDSLGTIASYYKSETDSLFNFDAGGPEGKLLAAARGNMKADSFAKALLNYETTLKSAYADAIDAPFITNHDMGRVTNALNSDPAAMKFAGGLLLSMSGSPFVYYGEEIGLKSKGSKDENKRLPMTWGEESGDTRGPSDADKGIVQNFEPVATQLEDEESILNYYKRALLIRNQNPEIARGSMSIIDKATAGNVAAICKCYDGSVIAVLYNNSASDAATIDSKKLYSIKNHMEQTASVVAKGIEVVAFLTTDNSTIAIENDEIVMPARSIVYLKLKEK